MKRLMFVTAILISASIFDSQDDLSKAIKKSNLQEVKRLSKKLTLTEAERNSYVLMAREMVENRQLALQAKKLEYPQKPIKKFYRFGGLGVAIFLVGLFAPLIAGTLNDHSSAANQFNVVSVGIGLCGAAAEIIYQIIAIKATMKYLKQQCLDAIEIQRILACWPHIANNAA
jgi:hypothetical protein